MRQDEGNMNYKEVGRVAALVCCLLGMSVASAQALVDQVTLVPSAAAVDVPVLAPQTFTVTTAGSYTVTLTDLDSPAALSSLQLAVVGSEGDGTVMNAAGSTTVSLQPGIYTVQPIAVAAAQSQGGSFTVQITPAGGGVALLQYEWPVSIESIVPMPGQSNVQTSFTVASAGTYQVTITDQQFPAALNSLLVYLAPQGGGAPVLEQQNGTNVSAAVNLAAETYDLFIIASANNTALAGLYSVNIAGGPGNSTVYASVNPVGSLPAAIPISVPAAATVNLQLTDLATPAALASFQAVATQGSVVLQSAASSGTYSFVASSGTILLYVAAQPSAAAGEGAYEAYATSAGTTLADVVQPVLASGSYGYAFATNLANGGTYQITTSDFAFPQAFTALSTAVVQHGAILSSNGNGGSFAALPGPLNVLIFPTLLSPSADSVFGVEVAPAGSSTPIYQTTQGVGATFYSQTITIATAGSYGLTLTDLGFPTSFGQLALMATQGAVREGTVVTGGQVTMNLAAGTYVLNVLATVKSSSNYGLYGVNLSPSPTVMISSSANSVTSGQKATLTWSSMNTSSCTASGAWSGALATSGSQMSGALTASSTFTITCTGAGGSAAQSVQVAVTAAATPSSGGGGAINLLTLLALAASLALVYRRRRRLAVGAEGNS
jgi:hypothetical protein